MSDVEDDRCSPTSDTDDDLPSAFVDNDDLRAFPDPKDAEDNGENVVLFNKEKVVFTQELVHTLGERFKDKLNKEDKSIRPIIFRRVCRQFLKGVDAELTIEPDALEVLQYAAQAYLVQMFSVANNRAAVEGRDAVLLSDVTFAKDVMTTTLGPKVLSGPAVDDWARQMLADSLGVGVPMGASFSHAVERIKDQFCDARACRDVGQDMAIMFDHFRVDKVLPPGQEILEFVKEGHTQSVRFSQAARENSRIRRKRAKRKYSATVTEDNPLSPKRQHLLPCFGDISCFSASDSESDTDDTGPSNEPAVGRQDE
jgi:histone H3/H4